MPPFNSPKINFNITISCIVNCNSTTGLYYIFGEHNQIRTDTRVTVRCDYNKSITTVSSPLHTPGTSPCLRVTRHNLDGEHRWNVPPHHNSNTQAPYPMTARNYVLETEMITHTSQKVKLYLHASIRCYGMTAVSNRLCPENEAVRESITAWRQVTLHVLRLTNVIKNPEGSEVHGLCSA
jgi:hypothetical protein